MIINIRHLIINANHIIIISIIIRSHRDDDPGCPSNSNTIL